MLLFWFVSVCVMENQRGRELGDKTWGEGWALMDFLGKMGWQVGKALTWFGNSGKGRPGTRWASVPESAGDG